MFISGLAVLVILGNSNVFLDFVSKTLVNVSSFLEDVADLFSSNASYTKVIGLPYLPVWNCNSPSNFPFGQGEFLSFVSNITAILFSKSMLVKVPVHPVWPIVL